MVDVCVVRNNLSLNRRSAENWRRRRRRRRGGDALLFPLHYASVNVLTSGGRGRPTAAFDESHGPRRRRATADDGRAPHALPLPLDDPGARMLMLAAAHGWRRRTLVAPKDSLLSHTYGTGAPVVVSIKGFDVSLAQDHGPGFGASGVLSQKRRHAVRLPLAHPDVDLVDLPRSDSGSRRGASSNDTRAVLEVLKLRGRATRRRVVVPLPLLELGHPHTAVRHAGPLSVSRDVILLPMGVRRDSVAGSQRGR